MCLVFVVTIIKNDCTVIVGCAFHINGVYLHQADCVSGLDMFIFSGVSAEY